MNSHSTVIWPALAGAMGTVAFQQLLERYGPSMVQQGGLMLHHVKQCAYCVGAYAKQYAYVLVGVGVLAAAVWLAVLHLIRVLREAQRLAEQQRQEESRKAAYWKAVQHDREKTRILAEAVSAYPRIVEMVEAMHYMHVNLFEDQELYVPCSYCDEVAKMMAPQAWDVFAYAREFLQERPTVAVKRYTEEGVHYCPWFKTDFFQRVVMNGEVGDYDYDKVWRMGETWGKVAKMIAAGNMLVREAGRLPMPEAPNANKKGKHVDHKHYKRGGKLVMNKTIMSDDDYDRLLREVNARDLDDAEQEYFDHLDAEESYGPVAARAQQRRYQRDMGPMLQAMARNGNLETAAAWRNYDRHAGGPEAPATMIAEPEKPQEKAVSSNTVLDMLAEQMQAVANEAAAMVQEAPEAACVKNWAFTEGWSSVATDELKRAYLDEAKKFVETHKKEVEKRLNNTAVRDVTPEGVTYFMSRAEAVPEVQLQEAVVALPKKASVHPVKKNAKRWAVVRPVEPESSVTGSTPVPLDRWVAAAEVVPGRVMQGYLTKRESNKVYFITGRHSGRLLPDGTVEDGFSHVAPNGDGCGSYITLYRPSTGVKGEKVMVKRYTAEGGADDRVCILLDYAPDTVLPAKVRTRKIEVGETVRVRYFMHGEWYDGHGPVRGTADNAVAYAISTVKGCCRMAVWDTAGQVVGGHYYPSFATALGRYPAAHLEPVVIPAKWNPRYAVVAPAGEPQAGEKRKGETELRAPRLRTEKHKIAALRTDLNMTWMKPEWYMAKPSTQMLHNEVAKYMEEPVHHYDKKLLSRAMECVCMLEKDAARPFVKPTYERMLEVVQGMDSDKTNAGSDCWGGTHRDYLKSLAMDDEGNVDMALGMQRAAEKALYLYELVSGERQPTEDDLCSELMLEFWCVQGKKDGYKLKKLDQGRSIQAPSFTLKAIYRACFQEADAVWVERDWMMRVGADLDLPVPNHLAQKYKYALDVLSLDETAFDRLMPQEFMEEFFFVYMQYMNPQVPLGLVKMLAQSTIHSYLVMTDGTVYQKHQGNPSGYPNTIRMNCVVQLLAWCYALLVKWDMTVEQVVECFNVDAFLEICGDDSRLTVLTERGRKLFSADEGFQPWLQVWRENLPWDVKIEGSVHYAHKWENGEVVYEEAVDDRLKRYPPLVARCLYPAFGVCWSPLHTPTRVLRKITSQGSQFALGAGGPQGRTEEAEIELQFSALMTCKLHLLLFSQGMIECPAVNFMAQNGWLQNTEHMRYVHASNAGLLRVAIACRTPLAKL